MKNKDKTLNLKASQAIASLGIECGSEKYWNEKTKKLSRLSERFEWGHSFNESGNEEERKHFIKNLPALNLQELLTPLPAIGEKLGLPKLANQLEENECEFTDGVMTTSTFIAHKLLDIFLVNYDMRDVSAEIIRIIKE